VNLGIFSIFNSALGFECKISKPNLETPAPFTYTNPGFGWYGDHMLAVLIPSNGIWQGMGENYNFRNKLLWWEKRNSLNPDNESAIKILATNLSNGTVLKKPAYAGNIYVGEKFTDWGGMLTALEFSSTGCWQVSGQFEGHKLEFTVLVKR